MKKDALQKNAFIICSGIKDGLEDIDNNKDFDIYARIIEINDNILIVDKYMKQGEYPIGIQTIEKDKIDNFCSYYTFMSDTELSDFQQGLLNLKRKKPFNDETKNTFQILTEYLKTYQEQEKEIEEYGK